MSRRRYEEIMNNLTVAPPREGADDKWQPVRYFVERINNRRVK